MFLKKWNALDLPGDQRRSDWNQISGVNWGRILFNFHLYNSGIQPLKILPVPQLNLQHVQQLENMFKPYLCRPRKAVQLLQVWQKIPNKKVISSNMKVYKAMINHTTAPSATTNSLRQVILSSMKEYTVMKNHTAAPSVAVHLHRDDCTGNLYNKAISSCMKQHTTSLFVMQQISSDSNYFLNNFYFSLFSVIVKRFVRNLPPK